MKMFDGKKVADGILKELKNNIHNDKFVPKLAIILVGKDRATKLYIKIKKQAAQRVGIIISQYNFKETVKEDEVIQKIITLNCDKSVNGIIVQLPLPKRFNSEGIISAIAPEKDVDGFHKVNRDLLKRGRNPHFSPVLPSAVLISLKAATKAFGGKKILALVNSDVFGQALKIFLKRKKVKMNYFLRKKLSFMKLKSKLKSTDIIITVCGCPELIKGNMVKEKVILIDAGITLNSKGKVVGDVDKESVEEKASFLTPVPGGIGPLTVALLLKNVYLAKKLYGHR